MTDGALSESGVTQLLLLDFDRTLTLYHTGGAACLLNSDNSICYDGLAQAPFAENAACDDAKFFMRTLADLVLRRRVCVSIITMSDKGHIEPCQKTRLRTEEMRNRYSVFGGRLMVLHWLYCIAERACENDR